MTTMADKEPFVTRWSRRRLEATEKSPAAALAAPHPAAMERQTPGASDGLSAEYLKFFDPQVDENLRRVALSKLFSDPQFNVMDALDTYIDDYSIPDLIPEAMLRQLNQAKALFLFDDEQKTAEAEGNDVLAVSAGTAAASPAEAANATALPQPAAAGALAQDTIAATGTAAAPPAEGFRND